MNEVYTDLEYDFKNEPRGREKKTYDNIYDTLQYVGRVFNLNLRVNTNDIEIKIKLPRKKIEQISRDMMIEYGKSATMVNVANMDMDGAVFTKFTTPFGKIEFIDNGE